jgi:putative ABC transport system permease protein
VLTFHHIRLSARFLLKDKGFTVAALVCIALAIGSNVAVFSILSAILLRPLPFADPNRLMVLSDTHAGPGTNSEAYEVSPPNFDIWRRDATSFSSLGAALPQSFAFSGGDEPERIAGAAVSAGFFETLGVKPVLGRTFTAEEDTPPGVDVVLVSEGFWRTRLGGDPGILGKTLRLDGKSYAVTGVVPSGFTFPQESRIWVPLALDPTREPLRFFHLLLVYGRLAPGVSFERAQESMASLASRLEREFPETNAGWGVEVKPIKEKLVGDLRPTLVALQVAVLLVLLIASANVANLMFARFEHRRAELAIRAALGEGRGDLVRQLFTEALLLAGAGGALGIGLAWLGIRWAKVAVPSPALRSVEVGIDGRVLLFALALVLVTSVLVSLVPILTRPDANLYAILLESGRKSSAGGRKHRILNSLVIAEIAVTMVLLILTGLLTRSLLELEKVPLGYDAKNLLTLRLSFPGPSYPTGLQRTAFLREALERIEALPGVESAGATIVLPVGDPTVSAMFTIEGRPPAFPGEVLLINQRMVSPEYLQTLRIPLVEGRYLSEADRADSERVVVVSKKTAETYWPGQSALGKRMKRGLPRPENPWMTVVGVVGDVRDTSLSADISPTWYLPYTQHDFQDYSLVLRTSGDPLPLARSVRQTIWSIDPNLPVEEVLTMEQNLADSLAKERFRIAFLWLSTGLGLVLAATGLYGLISYSVDKRTREIGIRMAMGARPATLLKMVLGQTMTLVVLGLALGGLMALGMGRLLSSMLFQVGPMDPLAFFAASLLLLVVALAAGFLPANRAAHVDATQCFRSE